VRAAIDLILDAPAARDLVFRGRVAGHDRIATAVIRAGAPAQNPPRPHLTNYP
jgi:hypothetical protein